MKLLCKFFFVLIFLSVVGNTGIASAAATKPQFYAGAKVGQMIIDRNGEDATNAGFTLGSTVHSADFGSLALEGDLTFTVNDGEINGASYTADWDIYTFGVYGVYRSNGKIYVKGKLGFVYENIELTNQSNPNLSVWGDGAGLSIGVGGGVEIGDRVGLEIEYTIIESDIDYLSAGIIYKF